jgi:hypothetical protein
MKHLKSRLQNLQQSFLLLAVAMLCVALTARAATHYVDLNSSAPLPPYTSWSNAAVTIQDAVDAAATGDEVVVTNGIYQTGGRSVTDGRTNRVVVTNALTVRSINGPEATIIQGYQEPRARPDFLGSNSVRCVYLSGGALLSGFTLTNGAGSDFQGIGRGGGGVWCDQQTIVSNCVLAGNVASSGGGADGNGGVLVGCTLKANTAYAGGGAACDLVLTNCTLVSNSVTLYNQSIAQFNPVLGGGGAFDCTLWNCSLIGNVTFITELAHTYGGGACNCQLNNCSLTGNSAASDQPNIGSSYGCGGGAADCDLTNCTLTGNSAFVGGGVYGSALYNSVVYHNVAAFGPNYVDDYTGGDTLWGDGPSWLDTCCTSPIPLPDSGTNNIGADPQLADSSHLSAASPCRGAGQAAYARGVDLDGKPWGSPPSIGCAEFVPGASTGPLLVAIQVRYTSVAVGFKVDFTAQISGNASASRWEFDDGTVQSNLCSISRTWSVVGEYAVILRVYNETYPAGVATTTTVHVTAPTHYVRLDNGNPVSPYSSWETAATNIQDALDAASVPGALVLVSNGVFNAGGGRVVLGSSNRIAILNPVAVRSVQGPTATVIDGGGAMQCAYVGGGALLAGFTLTNGGTKCHPYGLLANCLLTAGGTHGGTLNNCLLTGATSNPAAFEANLNGCTVENNSAPISWESAVMYSSLNNCIVCSNSPSDYDGSASTRFCCIPSAPYLYGVGNITNPPLLVDPASGNFRLQSNSPCINAGRNTYAAATTDLDGNPRIAGGTVDIGAYEYQTPASHISYAWLQQYGLPTDGSADFTDPDQDGMNNWQEWKAGTDPTNPESALRMLSLSNTSAGTTVAWSSAADHSYSLEWATNLTGQPAFSILSSNLPAQGSTTALIDTNDSPVGQRFYRVSVEE